MAEWIEGKTISKDYYTFFPFQFHEFMGINPDKWKRHLWKGNRNNEQKEKKSL